MLGHTLNCPQCGQQIQLPTVAELEDGLRDTDVFPPQGDDENGLLDATALEVGEPQVVSQQAAAEGADDDQPVLAMDLEHHATVGEGAGDDDDVEAAPLERKKRDDGELDMTPMVDVTFLLLIFFMVTASFSLQKSIPMPRSQSEQPSTNTEEQEEDDFETVTVEIDEFNGYLIIASDFERECTSKLAITSGLQEAFNASAGGMRLAITCHEKAKLQSLVDVMDAGTLANYGEIQITEVEELD
ncbi:ExbD/TolR family protein [Roseimaritima ulvae]|nr:biopolymer transporter ExbD [Roseimaritima ulvae]